MHRHRPLHPSVLREVEREEAARQAGFVAGLLGAMPRRWAGDLRRRFDRRAADDLPAANRWLMDATAAYRGHALPLSMTDRDICDRAEQCAADCAQRAVMYRDSLSVRAAMAAYCAAWGIEPPDGDVQDGHAIARMVDAQWWRRALRRLHARTVEAEAIRLGYVHARRDCYVSEESFQRRGQQVRRNAGYMESTELENEQGDRFTLAELAARSPSNRAVRRGELMTRIRGCEEIATDIGHVGEFVTVTCPSRMHARGYATGEENKRYDGTTPKEAQGHLSRCWARLRAAADRAGLLLYGFRIAEPHHDGCPHWHLLLFMPAAAVAAARALFRRYFLDAHDPHEPGAQENRLRFVAIEPGKGTAAGYVAKYVAKNIDGYALEADLFGNDALRASARVDAWASTWGIRQFQAIGQPPVGVWRELRRVPADVVPAMPGRMQEAWRAAQRDGERLADWRAYLVAQGFGGDRWRIELARVWSDEPGRYGEPKGWRPVGVAMGWSGEVFESVRHVWRIVGKSGVQGRGGAAASAPWTRVNNCTRGVGDGDSGTGAGGAGHGIGGGGCGRSGMEEGAGSCACDGGAIRWASAISYPSVVRRNSSTQEGGG
ncbi:MAG: replication endonuclease [Pseudomonadota bacterium]